MSHAGKWRGAGVRWLKFNAVGGVGIVVQLAVLAGLRSGLHLDYLLATAFAVEAAVLHNFVWHERFTWGGRVRISPRESLVRLMKFNLVTGAFSISGNLVIMKVLVDGTHLNYMLANVVTIAACSIVNFVVSDWLVFARAKA
jgi:putative flippase GtrA